MTDHHSRGLLVVVLIVLVVAIALTWPLGMGFFGMRPMVGGGFVARRPFGFWAFLVSGVVRLALVGLVVALVVYFAQSRESRSQPPGPESALDILKRRYAAGELTREQYEQMRSDLRS